MGIRRCRGARYGGGYVKPGVIQNSKQITRVFKSVFLSLRVGLIQLSEMPDTIAGTSRDGVGQGNVVNGYITTAHTARSM